MRLSAGNVCEQTQVGAILTDYSPLSIIASAQAMCPSKPSDSAIAR